MDNNKRAFLRRIVNIFIVGTAIVIMVDLLELDSISEHSEHYYNLIIAMVTKIIIILVAFIILVMCVLRLFDREINYDYMTGMYSRRKLFTDLKCLINGQKDFLICYIDFNDFKAINDNYGHAAGDALLKEFANRIRKLDCSKINGYRIGGDEFIVIIKNTQDTDSCIEKIWQVTEKDVEVVPGVFAKIAFAMGIAKNDFKSTADELIKKSDVHMYKNKQTF